jgi:hypothetical protein
MSLQKKLNGAGALFYCTSTANNRLTLILIVTMSTVLPRLLAMQRELNALIAELQGGSSAPSTPEVKPDAAVAEAPKKRGRPKKVVSEEDKEAAKKAGAEAAGAISDAVSSASEKPKRIITPEHLAKLKAGREARKERLKAEKAAETASSAASVAEPEAEVEAATE